MTTLNPTRRFGIRQYRYICDGRKIVLSRALATACGLYANESSPAADNLWREVCEDIRTRLPGEEWDIYVHHPWTSDGYPYPIANVDARY